MTYQLIETKTLGTAAASIEFTNIPQDGTDLLLLLSLRKSDGANYFGLAFNGSVANTSSRILLGTGSSVLSIAFSSAGKYNIFGYTTASGDTASTFGNSSVYLPNYTSSVAKSVSMDVVTENNGTAALQDLVAGLWNNTASLTSLTVVAADDNLNASGTFAAGSTASLYKITRGSSNGVVVS